MAYMIDKEKDYTVKGSLLIALQELLQIYNEFETIPMPEGKRDFFIGCLASEFEHINWNEV